MNFTNIAQDLDDIKNSLKDNIKKGDVTQEVLLNNWTLKTLYTSYYVNWKLTWKMKSTNTYKKIYKNNVMKYQLWEMKILDWRRQSMNKQNKSEKWTIMCKVYNNEQYSHKFNIKHINYLNQNNENVRKNLSTHRYSGIGFPLFAWTILFPFLSFFLVFLWLTCAISSEKSHYFLQFTIQPLPRSILIY